MNAFLSNAVNNVTLIYSELKVTPQLCEGQPADKIIEIAEAEHCALIVIGRRGLRGFKELFLGSVSGKVADHT